MVYGGKSPGMGSLEDVLDEVDVRGGGRKGEVVRFVTSGIV